ncbi:hypothetical protein GCM10028798_21430 [Humibacter antri]
MGRDGPDSHIEHARALSDRVADSGDTDRALRSAVLERAAGGAAVPEPYDELVGQIARDSARVTDAQVAAVLRAAGTEGKAFELILTAAIGTGLHRWNAAEAVIEEASDASD